MPTDERRGVAKARTCALRVNLMQSPDKALSLLILIFILIIIAAAASLD